MTWTIRRAKGAWGAYLRLYERHAPLMQLIFGAFLIATSIVLIVIALQVASDHSQSEQNTRIGCLRAREFAPPLGKFFERAHVFTVQQARDYRALIPSHC